MVVAEGMGDEHCQASGAEKSHRRTGTTARRDYGACGVMEPSSAGQGKWRRQSERRTPNCRSDNPAQRCPSRDDGCDEFALDSCVDRSTAISTRVRLFRLFLLIPCWESQRLIPKRSAGPRATKIGVVSLKALDHHRPNREESLLRR